MRCFLECPHARLREKGFHRPSGLHLMAVALQVNGSRSCCTSSWSSLPAIEVVGHEVETFTISIAFPTSPHHPAYSTAGDLKIILGIGLTTLSHAVSYVRMTVGKAKFIAIRGVVISGYYGFANVGDLKPLALLSAPEKIILSLIYRFMVINGNCCISGNYNVPG